MIFVSVVALGAVIVLLLVIAGKTASGDDGHFNRMISSVNKWCLETAKGFYFVRPRGPCRAGAAHEPGDSFFYLQVEVILL